jgi:hypothetical protein
MQRVARALGGSRPLQRRRVEPVGARPGSAVLAGSSVSAGAAASQSASACGASDAWARCAATDRARRRPATAAAATQR